MSIDAGGDILPHRRHADVPVIVTVIVAVPVSGFVNEPVNDTVGAASSSSIVNIWGFVPLMVQFWGLDNVKFTVSSDSSIVSVRIATGNVRSPDWPAVHVSVPLVAV